MARILRLIAVGQTNLCQRFEKEDVMRNLLIFGTMASAILLGSSSVRANESALPAVSTAVAQTALASNNLQDWRYRWHNGQWWYWTPGNYWMTYNNGAWNRYGGVGVGAGAYVGPRYNYYRGYPYYGNYYRPYNGNYYRGYPYYGGGYYPYRDYGPGGVAGRAAVRAFVR
jgi:hypothetical protein